MNETETNVPLSNSDLAWQVAALQRQVFLLLVALVVVSATIVFYLFCESHFVSQELSQSRPQIQQVIQTYRANEQTIENIDKQLVNYGMSHPAYQPILKKYNLLPTATQPRQ